MISHGEAVNIWLGAFGTAAFIGGLLSGHWWWPSRQRLDDEWDDGHAVGVDDESRGLAYVYDENGDELQSDFKNPVDISNLPSFNSAGANQIGPNPLPANGNFAFNTIFPYEFTKAYGVISGANASLGGTCDWGDCDDEAVGRRVDDEHGWLPVCVAHLADEDQVRPAGPFPAAGRTDDTVWLDDPDLVRRGRTYSELVMLAAQDAPELLDGPEPVDWYPEALRRSEDWLAACRAELGLVAT